MTRRSRLLLVLDVGLIAAAGLLGLQLHRVWVEGPRHPDMPRVSAPIQRSTLIAVEPPRVATPPGVSPPGSGAGFAEVAEQNLFSPTRSEVEPVPPSPRMGARQGRAEPPRPRPGKPFLYGIVLGATGGPRAYLKEPKTTKLIGYTIGEVVGQSVLEEIRADRVVLRDSDGEVVEVLLRDPSKPRRAVTVPPFRARAPVLPAPRPPGAWPRQPAR